MSDFRRKNKMQAHSGTDFAPAGSNRGKTAIPAVVTGKIELIQWSSVLGWVIVQSAKDVKTGKKVFIGYCHLSCGAHGINCPGPKAKGEHSPVQKKVGDVVKEGDIMAILGNTGSASSGAHLHLTIGHTVKSVFGATSEKFDFVAWVPTQAATTKGAPKTTAAKPKAPAAKKTCPTCGQETK